MEYERDGQIHECGDCKLLFPDNPTEEAVREFLRGLCTLQPEVAEERMSMLDDEQAGHIWMLIGRRYDKCRFDWAVNEILAGMEKDVFA